MQKKKTFFFLKWIVSKKQLTFEPEIFSLKSFIMEVSSAQ